MQASVPKAKFRWRKEQVRQSLLFLALPSHEFQLDDLLQVADLPTEQQLEQRLIDDGVLEGRYPAADAVARTILEYLKRDQRATRLDEFRNKLASCPSGKQHFATYEAIGREILEYLFASSLVLVKSQGTTLDGVHRRDVIYRNQQDRPFWRLVAQRQDAHYVVVDSKNYTAAITPKQLEEVAKYLNSRVGRFAIALSRKGASATVQAAQVRQLKDQGNVIIVVSDQQMLTMIEMKEDGENPEQVLEGLYDNLIVKA